MIMTKKIWIIEAYNDACWNAPIIKFNAKKAMDYVANEFESALSENPDYNKYWEMENGTGTASIISNDYSDCYNWRITEREIEFDILIDLM